MAQRDRDVTQILTTDHKEMLALLAQLEQTVDPEQRRDIIDTVTAEVMRHAVAEEMYVYPAIEERVPNGTAAVEHDKEEHEEIVQVMKQLEELDSRDAAFMERALVLKDLISHHGKHEEEEQFPQLRAHVAAEDLLELGRKVENAKALAPTRPHPGAPHSELFHKTVGTGIGMVDRLRDALTGRQTG